MGPRSPRSGKVFQHSRSRSSGLLSGSNALISLPHHSPNVSVNPRSIRRAQNTSTSCCLRTKPTSYRYVSPSGIPDSVSNDREVCCCPDTARVSVSVISNCCPKFLWGRLNSLEFTNAHSSMALSFSTRTYQKLRPSYREEIENAVKSASLGECFDSILFGISRCPIKMDCVEQRSALLYKHHKSSTVDPVVVSSHALSPAHEVPPRRCRHSGRRLCQVGPRRVREPTFLAPPLRGHAKIDWDR